MNITKRITLLLLAAIMCISAVACNKSDELPVDTDPDEFTGSISPDDENKEDDEVVEDTGDPTKTYEIRTPDDLKNMKIMGTYVLMNDIDMNGVEWKPIGTFSAPFEGTLQGNGYTIKNLTIVNSEQDSGVSLGFYYSYTGLLGVTDKATIKDLNIENVSVTATSTTEYLTVYTGALAGMLQNSKVTNCTVSGTVFAQSRRFICAAGGLAGHTIKTEIQNCSSNASVTVDESTTRAEGGGLIGNTSVGTVITKCSATGAVDVKSDIGIAYAGGLIGYANATKCTNAFTNSQVTATVTSAKSQEGKVGASYAGGIAGLVTAASLKTKSEFSYTYTTGGKVNSLGNENISFGGGLVGKAAYASFKNCYSVSDVYGNSNLEIIYVGGAFGDLTVTTTITGCFAKNNLSADIGKNTNVFMGTFSGYVPSVDEENPVTYISTSIYYSGSQFLINGEKAGNKLITNASARQLLIFNDFNSLIYDLKWNASEWKFENGLPIPTI